MQTAALRGADTRRDICGHSCWRASTGCVRSPLGEANAQQLIAPEAVEAIPELESSQTSGW